MMHELFAATLPPQLFVWLKSPLVPMLLMARVPLPELLSVTGWAALVVPVPWVPNVRLVGATLAMGGGLTVCVKGADVLPAKLMLSG